MWLGVINFSEKHANIGTLFWATVCKWQVLLPCPSHPHPHSPSPLPIASESSSSPCNDDDMPLLSPSSTPRPNNSPTNMNMNITFVLCELLQLHLAGTYHHCCHLPCPPSTHSPTNVNVNAETAYAFTFVCNSTVALGMYLWYSLAIYY